MRFRHVILRTLKSRCLDKADHMLGLLSSGLILGSSFCSYPLNIERLVERVKQAIYSHLPRIRASEVHHLIPRNGVCYNSMKVISKLQVMPIKRQANSRGENLFFQVD